MKKTLTEVRRYYEQKLREFGPTAEGMDWNSALSQRLRFEQLLKLTTAPEAFSINDLGCGAGALAGFLGESGPDFTYHGFDISEVMLAEARAAWNDPPRVAFVSDPADLPVADYTVASGLFNVKLEAGTEEWADHVEETIATMAGLSRKGFAFNALTSYSDPERMRPDLYYADPLAIFDHCKRRYSRWVSLLHDYGLYEFTVLVRADETVSWSHQ